MKQNEAEFKLNPTTIGVLSIEVADNGCGIPEKDQDNLFKPFSQANKAVHSKYGGTGLGLWLCHKLITSMEGTIKCKSVQGKGSTFHISIPMKYKKKCLNQTVCQHQV